MTKFIVTGSDGFIGNWLTKKLLDDGYSVIGVDNNIRGGRNTGDISHQNFLRLEINLCNIEQVRKITEFLADDTIICHLAAYNGTNNFYDVPWDVLRNSSLPLVNIIDVISSSKFRPKILYTGSSESYAETINQGMGVFPTAENIILSSGELLNPRWSYASAKTFGEYCLSAAHHQLGVDFLVARVHNIYGPRMGFNHFTSDIIKKLREGQCILPGATETRTFCYISDAVDALFKLINLDSTNWNQVFHVGSDEEISIIDAAATIADLMNLPRSRLIPKPSIAGSVHRRFPSIEKLRNATNYEPKVSFKSGMQKVIDWYTEEQIKLERDFR